MPIRIPITFVWLVLCIPALGLASDDVAPTTESSAQINIQRDKRLGGRCESQYIPFFGLDDPAAAAPAHSMFIGTATVG